MAIAALVLVLSVCSSLGIDTKDFVGVKINRGKETRTIIIISEFLHISPHLSSWLSTSFLMHSLRQSNFGNGRERGKQHIRAYFHECMHTMCGRNYCRSACTFEVKWFVCAHHSIVVCADSVNQRNPCPTPTFTGRATLPCWRQQGRIWRQPWRQRQLRREESFA